MSLHHTQLLLPRALLAFLVYLVHNLVTDLATHLAWLAVIGADSGADGEIMVSCFVHCLNPHIPCRGCELKLNLLFSSGCVSYHCVWGTQLMENRNKINQEVSWGKLASCWGSNRHILLPLTCGIFLHFQTVIIKEVALVNTSEGLVTRNQYKNDSSGIVKVKLVINYYWLVVCVFKLKDENSLLFPVFI